MSSSVIEYASLILSYQYLQLEYLTMWSSITGTYWKTALTLFLALSFQRILQRVHLRFCSRPVGICNPWRPIVQEVVVHALTLFLALSLLPLCFWLTFMNSRPRREPRRSTEKIVVTSYNFLFVCVSHCMLLGCSIPCTVILKCKFYFI